MQLDDIQPTIEKYWTGSAKGYSDLIHEELASHLKKAWVNKILINTPSKPELDILDIGTGPGFFPIILAGQNRKITAIDCTKKMLQMARQNADVAGVDVSFQEMDSHDLGFADSSFDLIVNRNVTWTLYDPIRAYTEWNRVLRPGGRLLIFDANWGGYCFDKRIREENELNLTLYRQKFGESRRTHKTNDEYIDRMFLSGKLRPQWDVQALEHIGYKVLTHADVSKELWDKSTQLLYDATPMFMIVAEKQ